MSTLSFKKMKLSDVRVPEETLDVPVVKTSTFKITSDVRSLLEETDDIALYLIASGVNVEELNAFMKVSALLSKAKYTKDVSPLVHKDWVKSIRECEFAEVPADVVMQEYVSRTTYNKTVVSAFASLLHIKKQPQAYLSLNTFQQDRGQVPSGFVETFKSYSQEDSADVKMSRDFLNKTVKSGCDNYLMAGGVQAVAGLPLDDKSYHSKVHAAGEAAQRDQAVLSSKLAEPFNFVCNGIDAAKSQSYEHAAARASSRIFPSSVLYCVDDKMSARDLQNDHLLDLPRHYSPYLKFKPLGMVGDTLTNDSVYTHLGVKFSYRFTEVHGIDVDSKPTYDQSALDFGDITPLMEIMASSEYVASGEGFKLGTFDCHNLIPARFNRLSSVDDLSIYTTSIQLISLGVLAGALKKSQVIFETHRFFLFDPLGHLCFAIPVGYSHYFPLLDQMRDPLIAADHSLVYVNSSNVKFYLAACSELCSYSFPVLFSFYEKPLVDRAKLLSVLNEVVVDAPHINGTAYARVSNLLFDTLLDQYVFIVGSNKTEDKRVASFHNETLLDLVTHSPQGKRIEKTLSKGGTLQPRNFSLFSKPSDVSGGGTVSVPADNSPPPENTNPLISDELRQASKLQGFDC